MNCQEILPGVMTFIFPALLSFSVLYSSVKGFLAFFYYYTLSAKIFSRKARRNSFTFTSLQPARPAE
jgi:hypothetical protein